MAACTAYPSPYLECHTEDVSYNSYCCILSTASLTGEFPGQILVSASDSTVNDQIANVLRHILQL